MRAYIKQNGGISIYERKDVKLRRSKPRCEICKGVLRFVYIRTLERVSRIGFICLTCKRVFLKGDLQFNPSDFRNALGEQIDLDHFYGGGP